MKILEIHYSTSWAGAERFVIDLSNELAKNNDITLCIIEDDTKKDNSYYKKEISPQIKYINLGCKSGLQLKALWKIFTLIKKEKPDIVHAHTDAICLFAPALLYKKTIYFHTLHNLAEICQKNKYLTPLYKFFYKKRINPITISDICFKSYNKLYRLNNATNINNGRSELFPSNQLEAVKKEVQELKQNPDDTVYIHIARCDKQKNQELLISTFNKFLENGHHAILLMIGASYNTPENKYLLNKAKAGIYWLGIKNNICDYLLCSDFFILSSLWEGLPISLLEAISLGVIPVCTPAGGIPNVIINEEIGYLSKDFSEEEFYKTMVNAYNNYNFFNKNNLKKYFIQNFSMKACANSYYTTFQKALK